MAHAFGVKTSSAIVMIVILIDVNDVGCTHTHSYDLVCSSGGGSYEGPVSVEEHDFIYFFYQHVFQVGIYHCWV